tara:strand:+ start:362 stop:1009 length:648 start_codon:yes stop_codon:yes gene_type:complete
MIGNQYIDNEAEASDDDIEIVQPETAEEHYVFNASEDVGEDDPDQLHRRVDNDIFDVDDSDDEAMRIAAHYESRYGNEVCEDSDIEAEEEARPKKRARSVRSDDSEDVTTVSEGDNTDGIAYSSVPDFDVDKLNTTKSQLVFVPGKKSCMRNEELSSSGSSTSYIYSLRVDLSRHVNGSEQDWKDFQTVYYIMYAASWLASKVGPFILIFTSFLW